ncbi:MAG: alkaline phosphatase family protein [Clostridia bacterium]|nr:alkaline phosphatase family protein [Clostridia bacterium]
MKVLLILSDGMRPDAIAEHKLTQYMQKNATYCMEARTVMPSVTLPCHMSLFHSVDPNRHGITSNTYVPQMRPVSGLFEQLAAKGKNCAMFYNWEELRDVARPGKQCMNICISGKRYGYEKSSQALFEAAKKQMQGKDVDFAFLYFGWPDDEGHKFGWMSNEYLHAANACCDMVLNLTEELDDDCVIIYTADHGGHDRMHGTDMHEDMTIPMFFLGKPFEKGKNMQGLSIKDIAPTVANLFEAEIPEEWDGSDIRCKA